MPPITLIAVIVAQTGRGPVVRAALQALRQPSLAESGCLQYDLHQDRDDPERFVMVEQWRDQAAIDQHDASAHFQHFIISRQADLISLELHFTHRVD
jgi:quinol monooxygenase YgiN